jgi:hypothetical protein
LIGASEKERICRNEKRIRPHLFQTFEGKVDVMFAAGAPVPRPAPAA